MRVRKALAPRVYPKLKKKESKLLLIIQFYGSTMILENEDFEHQRGHHFGTEAVQLFKASFGWSPQVTPSSSKPFTHEGVEWHVVILPVCVLYLSCIPEMKESVEASGARLIPIKEHPFYNRHLRRYE